jgi:hypothetical protein
MKQVREFVTSTLVGGLFIVVPVYLAVVLLLKGMKSVATLVRPFAVLLPEWVPAERLLSLLLVLFLCFLVGAAARTRSGRAVRERLERVFFERLPGYGVLRSLTQRLAGDGEESTRTRSSPHSSSKRSTTGGSPSLCRPSRRRLPGPCTFWTRCGFTCSTSPSRRRSGLSPAGARGRGT